MLYALSNHGLRLGTVALSCILGFAQAGTDAGKQASSGTKTVLRRAWPSAGACVPNVVIIKLKEGMHATSSSATTGLSSLDARLQKYGVFRLEPLITEALTVQKSARSAGLSRIYFAYFNGEVSPFTVAGDLREDSHLEYAEPKYLHRLAVAPNDPSFSDQAFFSNIKAAQAWELVKGEQGNVVIAVVDGGTDRDHPDLQANLWINADEIPGNGLDDDNNGYKDDVNGWNFANNTGDPSGLSSTPQSAHHGTHTAGLACAVTNNSLGVAGASWNAKLMAINAGHPTADRSIAFGYEGVLYAASNGAHVLSLSWGGDIASAFEQEVIDYATSLDVAIVAAAGNDGSATPFYPAAYRGVLAVANTTNADVRQGDSSFGTWVDVTAPGTNILSTLNNGAYGSQTGTSMSSPLVAGVVALVRTQHPDWRGVQASEQVRVTADNIDAQNPGFAGLMGQGRINALRAATETRPSLRAASVTFSDGDGDGVIEPGESVTVQASIINYLAPAANVSLTLSENDPYVTLNTASGTIAAIGTLEERTLAAPFRFTVAGNAPSGHPVDFTLSVSTVNYNDRERFTLTILPTFGNLSANNIETTVTSIGRLGYADASQSAQGIGFKYQGGPSLLYEGAIICGNSLNRISNAARGDDFIGNDLQYDRDFAAVSGGDLRISRPGARTDQESVGIFSDVAANNPMNVRITQETYAASRQPYEDLILLRYTVENLNATELNNFYIGCFFDWDIGASGNGDVAEYYAERRLGYCYNTTNGSRTYVGMSLIQGGNASFRAIYNNQNDAGNPSWGIYDGFTDEEKWESLLGGVSLIKAGPADVSYVLGSGPHRIPANGKVTLGFALLAGANLQDLYANADAAAQFWNELFATVVEEEPAPALPRDFALEQNYPNPFNPETFVKFQLPRASQVQLEVFDVAGRKIRTLVQKKLGAGSYEEKWDGKNDAGDPVPSGVYVYRVLADSFVHSRKMILLR
ncbi:MAG: S8 family serine peptidase [bacterium]